MLIPLKAPEDCSKAGSAGGASLHTTHRLHLACSYSRDIWLGPSAPESGTALLSLFSLSHWPTLLLLSTWERNVTFSCWGSYFNQHTWQAYLNSILNQDCVLLLYTEGEGPWQWDECWMLISFCSVAVQSPVTGANWKLTSQTRKISEGL